MNYFEIKAKLEKLAEIEMTEFYLTDEAAARTFKGRTNEDCQLCLVDPTSKKKNWAYPIDKVISKLFTSEQLINAKFSATYLKTVVEKIE